MSPPDLAHFMYFRIRPKRWFSRPATVYFSVHYACVPVCVCVCVCVCWLVAGRS